MVVVVVADKLNKVNRMYHADGKQIQKQVSISLVGDTLKSADLVVVCAQMFWPILIMDVFVAHPFI